jgi:alanine dehydrogenase
MGNCVSYIHCFKPSTILIETTEHPILAEHPILEEMIQVAFEETPVIEKQEDRRHNKNTTRNYDFPDFPDIIDDKHAKYMGAYEGKSELFWGIGIENETYLMQREINTSKQFRNLKQKRERYSVDYYKSFEPIALQKSIRTLSVLDALTYPMYINSHTFQATDVNQQHRTIYDVHATPNPTFTVSIHDRLLKECAYYQGIYGTSFAFDGDSLEFITQGFYCGTVSTCITELMEQKRRFLGEVAPLFSAWQLGDMVYPEHNYGLVSFLTTQNRNLSLCNNGTYHINLTLPSLLKDGVLANRNAFIQDHLQLIPYIQAVEPLIVACYGTPDVFSVAEPGLSYAIGSQRVRLSRYISLQTYDAEAPLNGKLLFVDKPEDPHFWHHGFENSPYLVNDKLGYDINFNKFKNHGLEIRFLEWFPEQYVGDLMNFLVLLAQHSLVKGKFILGRPAYASLLIKCVERGFRAMLTAAECNVVLRDLQLPLVLEPQRALELLRRISDQLYERYHDSPLVQQMSPGMTKPQLVSYNQMAYRQLQQDLFGKPTLIVRAETNPLESRAPLTPTDMGSLHREFTLLVESSSTRCYTDEAYQLQGVTVVAKDHWLTVPQAYVLGIKGIEGYHAQAGQTHLHFAHCFKNQAGSQDRLAELKNAAAFVDYEYMVDADGRRVLSFCGQSGKIGCYLALMAYYNRCKGVAIMPSFHEAYYDSLLVYLRSLPKQPTILLIGYGTVGKACKAVLDRLGLAYTIYTRHTVYSKADLLSYDIVIHAIRLCPPFSEPFLQAEDLRLPECQVSVICDISCDLGNPQNTLPIYDTFTTPLEPVRAVMPTTDLIAIPYLPSLESVVSSEQFSSTLVTFLPEIIGFQKAHEVEEKAAVLYRSYRSFLNSDTPNKAPSTLAQ